MGNHSHPDIFAPPLPAKPGTKMQWANLHGCALPLTIAQAAMQSKGPLIVLTADSRSASDLERELKIFLPHDVSVLHFPDRETLPYDTFSPHEDITSDRLLALSKLPTLSKGLLVVPVPTILHKLSPKAYVQGQSFQLKAGAPFIWDKIRIQLVESGYRAVSQVFNHGEFAVRGSIIDLFPMGQKEPIRIDLFGDEIDSLRFFDPETQRSTEKIESLNCLPAREFPLTEEAIALFRQNWRTKFSGDPKQSSIYEDISLGTPPSGIEYYLPLFFHETSTLFDYFPRDATFIRGFDLDKSCDQFWQEVVNRYEQYRYDIHRPILPPKDLFIQTNEFFALLNQFKQITLTEESQEEKGRFNTASLPDLTIESRKDNPLFKLQKFIEENVTKGQILFCAESAGRRESLLDLLAKIAIKPKVYPDWQTFFAQEASLGIVVAPIDEGVWLKDNNWFFVAENQLYGQQVMQRRRRQKATQEQEPSIRSLSELTIGSPVVHIDHGVGRYRGLVHLTVDNQPAEYLALEYADNAKLYVPVSSLHLISQYGSSQTLSAPLHKLGTDQWEKAKKKALTKAFDVAAELLDIYAKREAKEGYAFNRSEDEYFRFASNFPFEETPDQALAIEKVIEDMQSHKPMDRLVCGDVGFGKTEVALRASFVCASEGKQVVMLVPTTLLAQQHYSTFSDRFADWPFRLDLLSRFRSKKEQEATLEAIKQGKVDIVIGTHKLLNEEIKFPNLGLLIIDEEHRFGVRQKERIKSLRAEVDILTLTATPIPRTLNMAMSSLRDLSIIATPPAKRLSIKTFVREHNQALILEAILRELMRGGQVYYLHNDIETINKAAEKLSQEIPQARVGIAHGKMPERELEKVMSDFYHQRFNILVCTTIIETGIDVPSANTIIIERADKFGLAQLHQLRGRVGRSHHQAYAYCMTPPEKVMTNDAIKRLEALGSLEELGSGFTLATHDLEIRGAGELLGEEQSGDIEAIGFGLYMEILDKAVKSLKSGQKATLDMPLRKGTEIDLQIPALIPEDYLPDVHSRLILYKRIANANNESALNELQVEMIDRFGLLPQATKNLFRITLLKLKAEPIGIKKIEASNQGGKILFEPKPNVNPDKIIKMVQLKPRHFKLTGSDQIRFMFEMESVEDRFKVINDILDQLPVQ